MNTYSRLTRTSYDRFQIMEVLGLLTAMILITSRRTAFVNSVFMQANTDDIRFQEARDFHLLIADMKKVPKVV